MGSCCGSRSKNDNHVVHVQHKTEQYKLPKIIVTSQDSAIIYLDPSPTKSSKKLRNSLIHKFPNLVSCDGEKRIIKQIEMMKEKRFYIIVVKNIRHDTLKSMIIHPKIKAIYFSLEQNHFEQYSNSNKIKGFFTNHFDLKKNLFNDIRFDDY